MNPERPTNGAAPPIPEPAEGPRPTSEPSPASGSAEFDPYKFQAMSVSPTLRNELSHSKLERLGPEYFQDTIPPNHPIAPPTETPVEGALDLPTRKRRIGLVLAVLTLVAVLLRLHPWAEPAAPSGGPEKATAEKPPAIAPAPRHPVTSLPEVGTAAQEENPVTPPERRPETPKPSAESAAHKPAGTPSDTRPRVPSASALPPGASSAPARTFWNEPR